jgi:hypothetical protein
MAAYEYHVVNEYDSSSSDATYTVCVRVDTRIRDPQERIARAMLTCNCPGFTRRCPDGTDASRTCRHIRQEAAALARFKANGGSLHAPLHLRITPVAAPPPAPLNVLTEPPPVKRGRWAGLRIQR